MLVAVPYLAVANLCTILISRGAPEWLHLVVLLGIWNAFKFVLNGPVSLVRLAMTRMNETGQRHRLALGRHGGPLS